MNIFNVDFRYIILTVVLTSFISGCSTFSENDNSSLDTIDKESETLPESKKTYLKQPAQLVIEDNPFLTDSDSSEFSPVHAAIHGPSLPDNEEYTNLWDKVVSMYQIDSDNTAPINKQKQRYLKHKNYIRRISKRAQPYLYLIVEEIEKRGLPGELALLPVVESGYRVDVYSQASASGLWQFVPATGRHFGLKQNWWYDGRRDVLASTNAALEYLQQLNNYYDGDWLLALAAYNAGAGTVDKAIRKNRKKGLKTDFWSLDLPRETRHYVPRLLAIAELVENYKTYDLPLQPVANEPWLAKVNTGNQIDISLVAKITALTEAEIYTYNPGFKQWATAPDGPHYLLLPVNKVDLFNKNLAELDTEELISWQRHKIKSGESLSTIAKKYHISVRALKDTNKLKSSKIRAGKYLVIPVDSGSSELQLTSTKNKSSLIAKTTNTDKSVYKVKPGDSFWLIARKHKLSHKKLASINGLSVKSTLAVGQELVLDVQQEQNVSQLSRQSKDKQVTTKQISYKVQKGDSLYRISRQFKVSISDLKNWNQPQLSQNKYLKPGQKLTVYINIAG